MMAEIGHHFDNSVTDFFDRMNMSSDIEFSVMKQHAAISAFLASMYFENDEEVKADIKNIIDGGEDFRNRIVLVAVAGGKGANLGELSKIERIQIPEGFCVTADAYVRSVESSDEFDALLGELSAEELTKVSEMSGKIRGLIESLLIPAELEEEITTFPEKFGEKNAYAVRSSATAEDLPTVSFAGQQDAYLNIIGKDEILKHVSKCGASLFTDRAVIYCMQNQFDHRKVSFSVVIQKMVFPQASGILFTADLITMSRKVTSIDAGLSLVKHWY